MRITIQANQAKAGQMLTSQAKAKLFAKIASKKLDIETLEARRSDSLDFHEVAVWNIREALELAFRAGQQSGKSFDEVVSSLKLN